MAAAEPAVIGRGGVPRAKRAAGAAGGRDRGGRGALGEPRRAAEPRGGVRRDGAARGLARFLEEVALVSDQDTLEERPERVTLITLHAAKGLEFPVVFMVGLEEGLLPYRRALDDERELEEERRLTYVGMTRAKDRLYLVHARHRSAWGSGGVEVEPFRFLADLPRTCSTVGGRTPAHRAWGAWAGLVEARGR